MTKNSVIPFVWATLPFLPPPLAREQIELILLLLSSSPLSLSHAVLSFGAGWRRTKRKTGLMIAPMAQSQVKAMSAAYNLTSFIRKNIFLF